VSQAAGKTQIEAHVKGVSSKAAVKHQQSSSKSAVKQQPKRMSRTCSLRPAALFFTLLSGLQERTQKNSLNKALIAP
jgi:hypothetical protein